MCRSAHVGEHGVPGLDEGGDAVSLKLVGDILEVHADFGEVVHDVVRFPFLDADAVWSVVVQRFEERVDARTRLFDVFHTRRIGYAHKALAGLTERINGFSKAFAMTGWRLGYLLSNPELSEQLTPL